MRKSTILGLFVVVSYIILFFGIFGELSTARAGTVLLIILNVLAFVLTIPPEYMQWRVARKAVKCLLAGSANCITGYPHIGHRAINTLMVGFLYTVVMMAFVVLLDAILSLPDISLSILVCLLSGMLIVRMQLAYEIEAESGAYSSNLG